MDNDRQQDIKDEDNIDKGDNGICQIIQSGILYCTKYKSNLGHKAVYNCAMPYLTLLMMTGLEVLKDPKNKPINLCPECNPILLNRMMLNVQTKWAINLRHRENQLNMQRAR